MLKKNTPKLWREVSPRDIIQLSDAVTVIERMVSGKLPMAEHFDVKSILAVNAQSLIEWRFACVDENSGHCIVAKFADRTIQLFSITDVPQWRPATRQELIQEDALFLFQNPGSDNFQPSDLQYALDVSHDKLDGRKVRYDIKAQGEVTGKAEWIPGKSGLKDQIATIVEYRAAEVGFPENSDLIAKSLVRERDENGLAWLPVGASTGLKDAEGNDAKVEVEDPELFLVEVGAEDSALITMGLGRPLMDGDVTVLRR